MNKEFRLKCWIDIDDNRFFGPGPARLLSLIQEEGSIAKAAKQMNMSYKKAWDLIHTLNLKGKKPYVISHKGGEKGGGAELTSHGKEVLSKYQLLAKKLDSVIQEEEKLLQLM